MKPLKIYKVCVEKTYKEDILVVAENLADAHMRALKAERNGEIEIENCGGMVEVNGIYPADMSKQTYEEIRNLGIVNEAGDLVYDTSIMDDLEEATKKDAVEELLKKNHMEFDFVKENKDGIYPEF